MKKTLFVALLCFVATPAFCQEDLQMFETDTSVTLSQKKDRKPNIGNDAKKMEKITISPVLPSVSIHSSGNLPSEKPSFNSSVARAKQQQADDSKIPENLSKPVDFTAKNTNDIQIIIPTKNQAAKAQEENQEAKQNNPSNVIPQAKKAPPKMFAGAGKKQPQKPQQLAVPESPKVELFNIADIYLGMQPEDVIDAAAENGFEVTNVAYGIPSFMITDYERSCRESGLYQTRLIHECIRESARDNDVYYVSQLVFDRMDSKEKIVVLFSSSLTDNKAFKIDYTAFGDNSLGTSYKDLLKKTHRRDIFWKYVYDKYGKPVGQKVFFWGSPKKVYLKAFLAGNSMDGRIVLEDVQQTGVDYTQAEEQDKEKDINNPFHF